MMFMLGEESEVFGVLFLKSLLMCSNQQVPAEARGPSREACWLRGPAGILPPNKAVFKEKM